MLYEKFGTINFKLSPPFIAYQYWKDLLSPGIELGTSLLQSNNFSTEPGSPLD